MGAGRENWQMFESDFNTALQYLIQVEEGELNDVDNRVSARMASPV